MTRKSTPYRKQARHFGTLGLLISAALTPAGKIIAGATTAAIVVGSLATQIHHTSPPVTPPASPGVVSAPAHPVLTQTAAPPLIDIEHDGEILSLVMTDGTLGHDHVAGLDPTDSLPFADALGSGFDPHAHRRGVPHSASTGLPEPGSASPDGHPAPTQQSPHAQPPGGPNGAAPLGAGSPAGGTPSVTAGGTPSGDHHSAPTPQSPHAQPPAGQDGAPPSHDAPGSPGSSPRDPANDAGTPALPHDHDALQNDPHETPSETRENVAPPPVSGLAFDPVPPQDAGTPPTPLLFTPLTPTTSLTEESPAAVPEPSMIALMLLGLAAMAWTARRRIPN